LVPQVQAAEPFIWVKNLNQIRFQITGPLCSTDRGMQKRFVLLFKATFMAAHHHPHVYDPQHAGHAALHVLGGV
jgi:hypothetical protein